jgi:hypothetical protein
MSPCRRRTDWEVRPTAKRLLARALVQQPRRRRALPRPAPAGFPGERWIPQRFVALMLGGVQDCTRPAPPGRVRGLGRVAPEGHPPPLRPVVGPVLRVQARVVQRRALSRDPLDGPRRPAHRRRLVVRLAPAAPAGVAAHPLPRHRGAAARGRDVPTRRARWTAAAAPRRSSPKRPRKPSRRAWGGSRGRGPTGAPGAGWKEKDDQGLCTQ